MRKETNNEIDLLLRRLSRRDGESVRDAETQLDAIDGHHLDADELSSYAQNVLPKAARARYTAHLADCSTCRKLATELSLALGVTTAAAPVVETVPAVSGLKKFLASLFSPLVLRYAVPALGVIVVMVVGFVVMRQRGANERLVAQNDARTLQAPAALPESTASPQAYHDSLEDAGNAPGEKSTAAKGQNNEPAKPGQSTPGEPAGSSGGADVSRPSKSAAPIGETDVIAAAPINAQQTAQPINQRSVNELPVVHPTPPAPAAPKATITTDGVNNDESKTKKETEAKREAKSQTSDFQAGAREKQANEPARDAELRPAARSTSDRADPNKAKDDDGAAAPTGVGSLARARRSREESSANAETRSVAGRKFRKESGIWTDTAYDSSSRTINMARGSEQFRALVADEPGIGRIAEQLDGEVIVVWKGRPYRIR